MIYAQEEALEAENARLEDLAYEGNHQAALKLSADRAYQAMLRERARLEHRIGDEAWKKSAWQRFRDRFLGYTY